MARRRYQTGSLKIYGKRKKVWKLRWREDVVLPDGSLDREERKTVIGSLKELPTRKLALRRSELFLARVNRPDYRPIKSATLGEFVERWRPEVLKLSAPSSAKAAESHLSCHLLPRFGRMRLEGITQEEVQALIAGLAAKLRAHTVANILATLRGILKCAKQWGYVTAEVHTENLKMPRAGLRRPARFFTPQQVTAILGAAGEPWRTFFAVAAMTGMRPGEVCGLAVGDLDFESRVIHVRRSAYYSKLQEPKTQRSIATVPMPEPLEAILRDYLACRVSAPDGLLFATRNGTPHSENKIVQRKLWPILDQLGIPRCGLYAFRHGLGSLISKLKFSPAVAQAQLRHVDALTTLRYYTHLIGAEQQQAVQQAAEILRPVASSCVQIGA